MRGSDVILFQLKNIFTKTIQPLGNKCECRMMGMSTTLVIRLTLYIQENIYCTSCCSVNLVFGAMALHFSPSLVLDLLLKCNFQRCSESSNGSIKGYSTQNFTANIDFLISSSTIPQNEFFTFFTNLTFQPQFLLFTLHLLSILQL